MSKIKNYRKEQFCDKVQFNSIKELLNSNKHAKGISELIKYIEKYPEDSYAHYLYGKHLFNIGSLDGAEEEFQKAAMFPAKNYNAVLVGLAQTTFAKGDCDTARKYYEEAIRINPFNSFVPYIGLAQLEREEGNIYASLNILYSALDMESRPSRNPQSCTKNTVLLEIAKTLIRIGKKEEAKEIIAQISPDNSAEARNLNYSKGIVYESIHEMAKAKEYYTLAIDNSANDRLSHEARVKIAYIAINDKDSQTVINILEDRTDDIIAYGGDGIVPLGRAYLLEKRYVDAKKIFKLGISSDKYRNICAYYYAALRIQEGAIEEIQRVLENVISKMTTFDIGVSTELLRILYDEKDFLNMAEYIKKFRKFELTKAQDIILKKFEMTIPGNNICQINNCNTYDEEIAINNIVTGLGTRERGVRFSSDVDVRELFSNIQLDLIDDNMLPKILFYDVYKISMPNIGYEMDTALDTLIVKTLTNTKNIIDMYPAKTPELPTNGEASSSLEKEKVKVNRQISKFNARFNKFQNKINN